MRYASFFSRETGSSVGELELAVCLSGFVVALLCA